MSAPPRKRSGTEYGGDDGRQRESLEMYEQHCRPLPAVCILVSSIDTVLLKFEEHHTTGEGRSTSKRARA